MSSTRPRTFRTLTSLGALIRTRDRRRDATIPRRDQLPDDIAWLTHEQYGQVPAVIVLTGRVGRVEFSGTEFAAHWQTFCWPMHSRVVDRLSREDIQDMLQALHGELTRELPPVGASYTACFSVPRAVGGALADGSFFDLQFQSASWLREEQRRRVRASWDPIVIMRNLFGLDRIGDPWLDDAACRKRIDEKIRRRATQVLMQLWKSWAKDKVIGRALADQGVPVDDDRRTEYQPGDVSNRIFNRIPPAMRHTMFMGEIPDDPDDS